MLKSEAHPSGYLNFFANWEKLNQLILSESNLDTFGFVELGNKSTIVVEHTSVNPNKALHIGHVRNIIIGDTISRILRKADYKVHVLNYIDDSGLQVADILVGFTHFGFAQEPPDGKKFDHYCGDDVYVKTTQKYDEDSSLEEIHKDVLKEPKFRAANPNYIEGKPCVYVGSTSKTPEKRFKEHITGARNNRGRLYNCFAKDYGLYLQPKQFRKFNPMTTRKEAEEKEEERGMLLRDRGWGVWWGV